MVTGSVWTPTDVISTLCKKIKKIKITNNNNVHHSHIKHTLTKTQRRWDGRLTICLPSSNCRGLEAAFLFPCLRLAILISLVSRVLLDVLELELTCLYTLLSSDRVWTVRLPTVSCVSGLSWTQLNHSEFLISLLETNLVYMAYSYEHNDPNPTKC